MHCNAAAAYWTEYCNANRRSAYCAIIAMARAVKMRSVVKYYNRNAFQCFLFQCTLQTAINFTMQSFTARTSPKRDLALWGWCDIKAGKTHGSCRGLQCPVDKSKLCATSVVKRCEQCSATIAWYQKSAQLATRLVELATCLVQLDQPSHRWPTLPCFLKLDLDSSMGDYMMRPCCVPKLWNNI